MEGVKELPIFRITRVVIGFSVGSATEFSSGIRVFDCTEFEETVSPDELSSSSKIGRNESSSFVSAIFFLR